MAQLHRSVASLRIGGDDLIPDEISKLLGAQPTKAYKKGDIKQKTEQRNYLSRSGIWMLDALDRQPENVDGQITEILAKLSDDLSVWSSLAERFEIDLFCGWFMDAGDEGLTISPRSMAALSARQIELGICIYAPSNELETVIRGTWLPEQGTR
jgi:hypothetical protein